MLTKHKSIFSRTTANDIQLLAEGAKVKSKCQWRRWLYSMVINFGLFNMVICYSVVIHVHFCLCCVRFVKCPIKRTPRANTLTSCIHFNFLHTHSSILICAFSFVYTHSHSTLHTYASVYRLWFHLHNDIAIHTSIEWKQNKKK